MLDNNMIKEILTEVLAGINYEYKVITTPSFDDIAEESLSDYNKDGWELVNVVSRSSSDAEVYKMVFKRPVK